MKSIGLKLMKCEQNSWGGFYCRQSPHCSSEGNLVLEKRYICQQWFKGKSRIIGFFRVFVDIFLLTCRMTLIFFYWRKEQGWADILNTLNMAVGCIENFLGQSEKKKKNGSKNRVLAEISQGSTTRFWDPIFQKIGVLSLFLAYNMFGAW